MDTPEPARPSDGGAPLDLRTPHAAVQRLDESFASGARTARQKGGEQGGAALLAEGGAAGSPYAHAVSQHENEVPARAPPPLALKYDENALQARAKAFVAGPPMRFGNSALDRALQEGGAKAAFVEVAGLSGAGKTEALLNMVAISVLPATFEADPWGEIQVGGSGVNVLYFCMGCTASQILPTVIDILSTLLGTRWTALRHTDPPPEWLETAINHSLARLHVVECSSSLQLLCSVRSIPGLLASAPRTAAVVLDSISAFYWVDKLGHANVEHSMRLLDASIAALGAIARQHNLVVYAARWMQLESKGAKGSRKEKTPQLLGGETGASKKWKQLWTHRVTLSTNGMGAASRSHYAQVQCRDGRASQTFSVTPFVNC